MIKGKLIVIDGLDSSGKETQTKLLKKYLEEKDFEITKIEFPYYKSGSGALIKRYLVGEENLSQRTINMVYSVNRYEQKSYIENMLNLGMIVICDRYYYSNMAYGSDENNLMRDIAAMDSEMPQPDLIIYLDIHPEVSFKRSGKTADNNERDIALLKKARSNYHKMSYHRDNWVTLNGEESIQEIHEQIVAIVENRLFK